MLYAHVGGDSIPDLEFAALDLARRLYGPSEVAELVIEGMSEIASSRHPDGSQVRASVVVRCVNYAEILPPGGTLIPDWLPEDFDWAADPAQIGLPGSGGEDTQP